MISSDQWRAYNAAVDSIRSAAEDEVREGVLDWLNEHPGASVAEAREEASRIMRGAVQRHDKAAASLAAEWYDALGRASGAPLDRAVTAPTYSGDAVDTLARYQVRKYMDGDLAGFAAMCGEFAANDAMRSVNETILRNARRDRAKGARFARVTSGRNTCSFCLMLAGRGAVYHTRESAGEFNQWHRHCTCKVVPNFSGDKWETLVEGHDPKAIHDRLREVERLTGARRGTPEFSREVELRDPEWLYGGEVEISYQKPREDLLAHERYAVDALAQAGLSFTVLDEDDLAPASIDLYSRSGEFWEMKDVGDGRHSIEDQLKNARSKWRRLGLEGPVRVVVTGTKMTRSDDSAIAEIGNRSRYFDEVIFVRKDGTLLRIVK